MSNLVQKMESKDQLETSNQMVADINIDINGDTADSNGIKGMNVVPISEGRVGLSKEELMKYANQPFWVRLRNILFASFWIFWFSILVVAIGYVVHSPGCTRLVVSAANSANLTVPATPNSGTAA